jgi:hypothetical protein
MPRFTNTEYRSLNESISHVANPAAALARAEEYAELLEEVVAALCAELEIDPQALVEDVMTGARMREHDKALKPLYTANRNTPAGKVNKPVDRAINARRALAAREQKSKTFIGRGGKPVKREPTAAEKRKSRDYDPR